MNIDLLNIENRIPSQLIQFNHINMIASLQQYNVIYKYNVDSGRRKHRLKLIHIPTKLKPRWRKKGKSKRKSEAPAPSTYTCYCVFFSSHYSIQSLYSHHRYKFDSSNSEKPLKPNGLLSTKKNRTSWPSMLAEA